jgi:cobalt-zinc-cadmium resistance protein CzcA
VLDRIVAFALKNRTAVVFLALVTLVMGFLAFRSLTIEAFPDPTDTQVTVITLYPGQPSEEVERQINLPLERALNGTPGLTRLRGISLFGLSSVTLTFDDNVDGLWARQQVLERLRDAELPEGITPELGPYATPIGEIYRYTLTGAKSDPMKLRTLQDWVVRPMLMRVNGVADVVSYGGLQKEIHVQPNPSRMAAFGLTLADVEDAIKNGSVNASGGILERGAEQFIIRSDGLFHDLGDLQRTRVVTRDGTPVLLRDVAAVTEGWATRQGVVGRGNNSDTVQGIVLMRRGENPSELLARVREGVQQVNERLLPEGAKIDPFYDRTDLVDTTLKTVGRNLLEGAILVTLVLFAFLLDLKAALIVGTLIPLSLAVSFAYLRMRGFSANLLSMGAVDFGIIVDGGVVIIESILTRLAPHGGVGTAKNADEMGDAVRSATQAVVRPTAFALLIIMAAYLPIFMLQRVEGRIFAPMANTVASALCGALIFSVLLVPTLASLVYRKPIRHRESPLLRWARWGYQPTLRFALQRPFLILAVAALGLGASVMVLPRLGSEFLPELNEGGLYLTFSLPSNIGLTEGRRMVPELNRLIAANPQVDAVMSQLGRPEDGTDPKLSNNLEFFVKLKPASAWPKSTKTLGDVIDALQRSVSTVPGVEINFSQPIRDNVNESISGQQGQIAVKIFGNDLKLLQPYAEKVKGVLSHVGGVADLGLVKSATVPYLQVTPDREALARYGMHVSAFQHVLQSALGGLPVSEYWEGERRFDIVLRLPPAARDEEEKIRKLQVPIADGATVPLEALAHVTTGIGRAAISRENGRRYIGVRMNVRGRDLGSFVEEARTSIAKLAPAPAGVTMEWGGEFENKERAMARLGTVLPVALLLTLALLFKAFDSFGLAVLTLLNVPFALVGGVFGLYLAGMPLSISAAVGFIALIGQASLNGVLVLSSIAERHRGGRPVSEAIVEGSLDRLRPVLMTALLAALGLIPAAMSHGIGSETQRPLAVVIVAGTLSACALALVVLPVMYGLYARIVVRPDVIDINQVRELRRQANR